MKKLIGLIGCLVFSSFAFAAPTHHADLLKHHTNALKACEHHKASHDQHKGCLEGFHLAMHPQNAVHIIAGHKACHGEKDHAKHTACLEAHFKAVK
jgi:hypothetical protein